jgi:prepilin-type N-terminal cleavage/methylation domain-containing protein
MEGTMGKKKGFTLIELLVVVAIIIILAMILMGAFLKAQEKAKQAVCIAHGRQIGMAMLMYVDDYDGVFPGKFATPNDGIQNIPYPWNNPTKYFYSNPINGVPNPEYAPTQFKRIDGSLRTYDKPGYPNWPAFNEYIKNKDVWICPNARWYYGERYAKGFLISWIYRTDDWTDPGNGLDPGWAGRTIKQIENAMYSSPYNWLPSKVGIDRKIMFHCYATRQYSGNGPGGILGLPYCSHSDGSVYVYMDGHAGYAQLASSGFFPVGYGLKPDFKN